MSLPWAYLREAITQCWAQLFLAKVPSGVHGRQQHEPRGAHHQLSPGTALLSQSQAAARLKDTAAAAAAAAGNDRQDRKPGASPHCPLQYRQYRHG